MIMVRNEGDPAPEVVEYRHGLTPPMRDARRRRFRREPDLNVRFLIILKLNLDSRGGSLYPFTCEWVNSGYV